MALTKKDAHQQMRMQVWSNAFNATANANDCKKSKIAVAWADRALEAFDERFPAPKED